MPEWWIILGVYVVAIFWPIVLVAVLWRIWTKQMRVTFRVWRR